MSSADPSDGSDEIEQVRRAGRAYEDALVAGDTEAAAGFFHTSGPVSRFGPEGAQLDAEAVAALRAGYAPMPEPSWVHEEPRRLAPGVVAHLALLDRGGVRIQRTQIWTRGEGGWRITHAHVSKVERAR